MRLLQINSVCNTGSTGRIAEEIGQLVISQGGTSCIAYGRGQATSQSMQLKIGEKFDIYRHVLSSRLRDNHGFSSIQATRQFVTQMRKYKPDIVHLHNIHGYYINIEILFKALQMMKVPVVWTLHDCWSFTGHCSHFTSIDCTKWKTQCFSCEQKNEYPSSWFCDNSRSNYQRKRAAFCSLGNCLTLVPVSAWLSNLLIDSYLNGIPKLLIRNGIDTNVFSPSKGKDARQKYHLTDSFVVLGVASIWSNSKGLKDFISLRNLLPQDVHIVLVGLTSEQVKSLPPGITGITRTENIEELAQLYAMADIFVNPTWEDNFPTTNIEALSSGTPVITYRTGGSPEAISEDTGFVVDRGDLQAVVDTIKHLQSSNLNYRTQCRQRAVTEFNKNTQYQKYLSLYDSLL